MATDSTKPIQRRTATIELPSAVETVVRRVFDAPPALVFETWTKPEHVRRWYGLRELSTTACDIDLKVGGRWRWAQTEEDGTEVAFSGIYREISPPSRLVFTEEFEAMPGTEYLVTMTFEEHGPSSTLLTTHMLYRSQEHRDGHLASGMEWGTNETYARLDELLEELTQTARSKFPHQPGGSGRP